MTAVLRFAWILTLGLLPSGTACAAWITIRNETTQELVIQEYVIVNGKAKPGKSIKLLPGESIRENRVKAGTKTVMIFDPANLKTPLAKGKVEWGTDDVTFAIQSEKNATMIAVVPPPKKP